GRSIEINVAGHRPLGGLKERYYAALSGSQFKAPGFAGGYLLSGSIVLVGNTLHWLEFHGRCDDGIVSRLLKEIKEI
ncbi:MAG: hypothetical protein PVJ39_17605, partial [Gammaproteobacteria bacterium]